MLFLFTGFQNDGKTLSGTKYVFNDFWMGRRIYSNTPLNFPHILINKDFIKYIVKNQIQMPLNTTFFLDEFWIWADARRRDSQLSYFYLQSSKDNMNIFFTAQTGRQNDIRLRDNLHYWVECYRMYVHDNVIMDIPEKYRMFRTELPDFIKNNIIIRLIHNKRSKYKNVDFEEYKRSFILAKMFYELYNTRAKIKR